VGSSKTRRRRELELAKAARQAERRRARAARQVRIMTIVAISVLVALGGGIAALLIATGDDGSTATAAAASASPTATATPPATSKVGNCTYTSTGEKPARPVSLPPAAPSVDHSPATMTITTNQGTMTAALDAAKAPCTVHALRLLAAAKFYDNTPCHRQTTANIFVLQCGDPLGNSQGGPGYGYANENTANVTYDRGVIAMAHSQQPDSNGSQFFLNYKAPTADGVALLKGGYTVVGKITQGLDVLDKITSPGVQGGGQDGAPASKPQITSITIAQGS
jgi:peptidyl-prolyl cis-trans isomerase B (cyclophilin B)